MTPSPSIFFLYFPFPRDLCKQSISRDVSPNLLPLRFHPPNFLLEFRVATSNGSFQKYPPVSEIPQSGLAVLAIVCDIDGRKNL